MEHKFLYIKKGRKKIRSKPFDFEAMCLIDDNREKECGILEKTADSLFYMFEGTEITEPDIEKLSGEELTVLCTKLFLWYRETILQAMQNSRNHEKANGDFHLRDIYRKAFMAWGTLPSALAMQNPRLLLYVLSGGEEPEESACEINPQSKIFYGM